jgi:hypothetical protein
MIEEVSEVVAMMANVRKDQEMMEDILREELIEPYEMML